MTAKQPILPVSNSNKRPNSLLHPKFLVSLLDGGKEPPYYAGDIYDPKLTTQAEEWKTET